MRRFDENATLDRLAEKGEIDEPLAEALGRAVAAAHSGARVVDPEPWIDALAGYIEEHVATFGARPELFAAAEIEALARASRAAYARIRPLLIERGRRGLARRIHGDLHLGNIVLLEGRPVLFDAIEFSALIASGDVFYDLAFLLMDLSERGLAAPANIVLNRYLIETKRAEDLDALAALPFFLSMRAAIRAKVTAARLEQAQPGQREAIEQGARNYFAFACRVIEPPASAAGRGRWAFRYRQIPPCTRAGARRSEPRPVRWSCAQMSSARYCSAATSMTSFRRRPTRRR